jgi:hypothetical protein
MEEQPRWQSLTQLCLYRPGSSRDLSPQQHTEKLVATRGHAVERGYRRLASHASLWAAAGLAVRSPVGSIQSHKRRFARGTGIRKDPARRDIGSQATTRCKRERKTGAV